MKKKFKSDQERIIHEIDKHTRDRHYIKAVYVHPSIKLDENVVKPYPVFRKNSISGWYIELA